MVIKEDMQEVVKPPPQKKEKANVMPTAEPEMELHLIQSLLVPRSEHSC